MIGSRVLGIFRKPFSLVIWAIILLPAAACWATIIMGPRCDASKLTEQQLALEEAIKQSDSKLAVQLIKDVPSLDFCVPGYQGDFLILDEAIYLREPEVASALLARGVRQTRMSYAWLAGDKSTLESDEDKDVAIAELLVDADRQTLQANSYDLVPGTARNHHYKLLKFWLQHGLSIEDTHERGNTAMSDAVSRGDLDQVRLLLSMGANPNGVPTFDPRPIFSAIERMNPEMVKCLIDGGADVNALRIISSGEEIPPSNDYKMVTLSPLEATYQRLRKPDLSADDRVNLVIIKRDIELAGGKRVRTLS